MVSLILTINVLLVMNEFNRKTSVTGIFHMCNLIIRASCYTLSKTFAMSKNIMPVDCFFFFVESFYDLFSNP